MSAQTELKARAKKYLVDSLSHPDNIGGWYQVAGIINLLSLGGYKVGVTSARRYLSELVEENAILKENNLFCVPKPEVEEVAEEVVEEEIAEEEIVEEEVVEEDTVEEVDDDKILETVTQLASEIIRSGKTASFTVEMKDGSSKTYACNNLERLSSVITKIIPDESLVQKVEVCEATAATVSLPSPKAEEKKPEVQVEKKGGRTKKSEPVAKEPKIKPAKPAKPAKYTRAHALADALKIAKLTNARVTKMDLIDMSNKQYVEHGGKDNLKESKWYFSNVIGILELMGTVQIGADDVRVA